MRYNNAMFEQCLYFNTASLARQLEKEWTSAFKPFGLTPSQAFMQSELASEMNISRPTATRALDGLERLSLIKRVASDKDGREQEIHPTKKAAEMKEAINAASVAVAKRLKKSLGTSHFEDAVDQIRGISAALK